MQTNTQLTKSPEKLDFMGFHSYVNQNCIIDRMWSGCYNKCAFE